MEYLCGIDEAGRGPLAGPVTAAAVVLTETTDKKLLNDSKALKPEYRTASAKHILSTAYTGIGWAWASEIDQLNIHYATLLAMKRAFENLSIDPTKALIDGKFIPHIVCPSEAVVKGDSFIPEIQAASIIAKTARDLWMIRYSWIDGRYLFEKHKGYPTKEHRTRLTQYGPCSIHRQSYRHVRSAEPKATQV